MERAGVPNVYVLGACHTSERKKYCNPNIIDKKPLYNTIQIKAFYLSQYFIYLKDTEPPDP